eukprot:4762891-Amphidinium_carterae.2
MDGLTTKCETLVVMRVQKKRQCDGTNNSTPGEQSGDHVQKEQQQRATRHNGGEAFCYHGQ